MLPTEKVFFEVLKPKLGNKFGEAFKTFLDYQKVGCGLVVIQILVVAIVCGKLGETIQRLEDYYANHLGGGLNHLLDQIYLTLKEEEHDSLA